MLSTPHIQRFSSRHRKTALGKTGACPREDRDMSSGRQGRVLGKAGMRFPTLLLKIVKRQGIAVPYGIGVLPYPFAEDKEAGLAGEH